LKIGIVGGGFTGLVAGYNLAKKGHAVTILEQETVCGGLVGTVKIGDQLQEKFYHHIFTSDHDLIDLISELGLVADLRWLIPNNSTYLNQKFYPFNTPLDLLLFKELPLIERVLMGVLVLRSRFINDWKQLERINAKDWVIKNAGKKAYEKFWRPLLYSKFDTDADRIAAVWLWNKFKLRGSTRGKNLNTELLGYLQGSFGRITEQLTRNILALGGAIECSAAVKQIIPQNDGRLELVTENNRVTTFERLIVTTSPDLLLNLKLAFPEEYTGRLAKIQYKANICMILELTKPLSNYYWTTIADNRIPFVAVIEHTNLVRDPAYQTHLVYLSRYLDEGNELYRASDEQISTIFIQYLQQMYPTWQAADIKKIHIHRARFTQPVVMQEYSKVVPDYQTPVPNLFLASMAQIYPEDRGQNYAVKMGRAIADIVQRTARR
jgi:protoporphyrinogen oxidase